MHLHLNLYVPRAFFRGQETDEFEQYFKENPYFSDAVLKKEFKFVPPPSAVDDKPDENGITESMVDFSWERDIVPSVRPLHLLVRLYLNSLRPLKSTGKTLPLH